MADRVREVATLMGIEDLLDRRPAELSGGQQQRTAIGRALALPVDVLLLDEPLANLDYKLREQLRVDLADLFRESGRIVLWATAEPAEALGFAAPTVVLGEGRVLRTGDVGDLYRHPPMLAVAAALSDPPLNLLPGLAGDGRITCLGASFPAPGARGEARPVTLGVRPHQVAIERRGPDDLALPAEIRLGEVTGSSTFLHLRVPDAGSGEQAGADRTAPRPPTVPAPCTSSPSSPAPGSSRPASPRRRTSTRPTSSSSTPRPAACSRRTRRRWTCMADIRLEGVAHSYDGGATWALRPITMTWQEQRAYALLGPSGCGKTTLLNIISGLVTPTQGRIWFGDREVTRVPTHARNIAQVFQFPVLYDGMSRTIGGRKRPCCSSVPKAISVGASRCSPMWFTRPGRSARAYSSANITCCISVAPRPPCSLGQPSPIQPASPSTRSHARRTSNPSCSRPGPPRPRALGELAHEVVAEPAPDLGPEGLVLGREAEVHQASARWACRLTAAAWRMASSWSMHRHRAPGRRVPSQAGLDLLGRPAPVRVHGPHLAGWFQTAILPPTAVYTCPVMCRALSDSR